jgi:hypothetical protein
VQDQGTKWRQQAHTWGFLPPCLSRNLTNEIGSVCEGPRKVCVMSVLEPGHELLHSPLQAMPDCKGSRPEQGHACAETDSNGSSAAWPQTWGSAIQL